VDSRLVEDLPGDGAVPSYPCNPRPQGGPEAVYMVSLAAPARLRVRVFADDGADADLHWLIGPSPNDCALRGDHDIEVLAGAGTHRIVVDFAGEVGHARAAGYRLTIVRLD
jgi:hypothetical protein